MGCSCKNKQNQSNQQPLPQKNTSSQDSVKKVIEKYYNKNKK